MHISFTEKVNISALYETNRFEVTEGKIFFLALTLYFSFLARTVSALKLFFPSLKGPHSPSSRARFELKFLHVA